MKKIKRLFKLLANALGFDYRVIKSYGSLPRFLRDKSKWTKTGGEVTRLYPVLKDFGDSAGTVKGHYFHQDLLVASAIFKNKPKRHIDVASRLDGFVAHVAAFRQIEVFDIRALPSSGHGNIIFTQADLMAHNSSEITDSLSCLHAIEHFGLGRYGDSIDVDGHIKGIENLVRLLESKGTLYLSFPIGMKDEVHFNAHRAFHPESVLRIDTVHKNLLLKRFDFVDDEGDLHADKDVTDAVGHIKFGCGVYTFQKK